MTDPHTGQPNELEPVDIFVRIASAIFLILFTAAMNVALIGLRRVTLFAIGAAILAGLVGTFYLMAS